MLAKHPDTAMPVDPTAFGNNGFQWTCRSWPSAKRMLFDEWTASADSVALNGSDEHTFTIANRGTPPAWPKFLYTGW